MIATKEFHISDLLDDGINGEYEMCDADGNSVGTVNVSINFESGDGKCSLFSLFANFKLIRICDCSVSTTTPYRNDCNILTMLYLNFAFVCFVFFSELLRYDGFHAAQVGRLSFRLRIHPFSSIRLESLSFCVGVCLTMFLSRFETDEYATSYSPNAKTLLLRFVNLTILLDQY